MQRFSRVLCSLLLGIAVSGPLSAQTPVTVTNTNTNPVPVTPVPGSTMNVADVQNPALNPFQKTITIAGTSPSGTFTSPATSGERFVIEFVSAICTTRDNVSVGTTVASGSAKYYFSAANAVSQVTRFYADAGTSIGVKATVAGNTCHVSISGYIFKFAVG